MEAFVEKAGSRIFFLRIALRILLGLLRTRT
jgi:hypothetical protein